MSARTLSPILLFVTGLAFGETPDALLTRAKQVLKTPGHGAQAVTLLRQANEQWKAANDTSPAYADSPDLFAVLALKDAPDDARTAAAAAVPPLSVERLGPGISNPSLTSKHEPDYTNYAIYRQVQGSVALAIVISAEGIPTQFQLMRGLGYELDEAAALAVKKWRFRPAARANVPVAVHANIEMNFRPLHNAPLP